MTVTLDDAILKYLTQTHPCSSLKAEEEEARKIAQIVLTTLENVPQVSKQEELNFIVEKIKENTSQRSRLFCESFCAIAKTSNWKDAIIGSHCNEMIKIKHPFIAYSNDINHLITFKERFEASSGKNISVFWGSTFATNKKHRLDDKGNHLLDAAYGVECYDKTGNFSGFSLALADGSGGHFGDDIQDNRIARAAYFASKSCVRLFSSYHKADELKKDIPSLILSIKPEVQQKGCGEGTTLIACRAFLEGDTFRLLGFNIGDCMMVAWDPQSKKLYSLLPSHVSEAGTAIFPINYRSFEVHHLDEKLPVGSFVFLLSDGVHDFLAYTEEESTYSNGLSYRTRCLKQVDQLFQDIENTDSVEVYLQAIMQKVVVNSEKFRRKSLEEETQIGDDVSIIGCCLRKKENIFHTVVTSFKKFFT